MNEFKTMVKTLHAGRPRGDPRRGLQPHRRGQRERARRCRFRGIDNCAYYRLGDDKRFYADFTGCGNSLDLRNPRVLQLVVDSLRYWVDRDARRRLPLRPRLDARARAAPRSTRSSPFFDVLRQDPVLAPRQADRRAVGPRRRRLPGRRLPARLGGMERPVPRHHARLLEGRRRPHRRFRAAPHRLARPLRAQRAAAPSRASTSSPRTTASRCTTSSRTTRSTTRPTARTTATATTTTSRGTAAPRARPTTRRSTRCASARSATSSRRCCSRRACRCSLAGDEVGRTQKRQQQRLLPGQRDQLARLVLGRRALALLNFTKQDDPRCAASTRSSGAAISSTACRVGDVGPQGRRVAQARRPGDDRRGVGEGVRALPRHVARRRRRCRRPTSADARCTTTSFLRALQRAPRRDRVHAARRSDGRAMARRHRHRVRGRRPRAEAATRRSGAYPLQGRSLAILREVSTRDAMKRTHSMPFGARAAPKAATRFRSVGAGAANGSSSCSAATTPRSIAMHARRRTAGTSERRGDAPPGTRYAFASTTAIAVPDPASRCNPWDVHGAERGRRPARVRVERRRLARPAVARGRGLRAARRARSRPKARFAAAIAQARPPRATRRHGASS